MNKIFITGLLVLSCQAMAQKFKAGFLAGLTTSQITGDQLAGYNKLGGKFGTFIIYPLNKKSSLKMEIQISQKGSKKPYIENSLQTYSFQLNYIEAPISFDYEVNQFVSIESGISLGYLVSFKEENEIGEIITEAPNDIAMDFMLGANYQWKKNTKINIRIGHSIIPIRADSSEGEWGLNKGQNSSIISLSIYYQIPSL